MRLPFGSYLKQLRQDHRLTLRDVSASIDIDQSSLSKIEKGKMIAPQHIVKPASALFDVSFRELQIHFLQHKWLQIYERVPFALAALEEALDHLRTKQRTTDLSAMITDVVRQYFADKPVERVWLFGSAARQEFTTVSDIDLLIQLEDAHNLDLFDYMGMSDDLEKLFDRRIDLVVEGQLDSTIADRVHAEKELIYEQR